MQAPERLQPLIEGVAIARPPVLLFDSPLPPLAPPGPYRYLNVPSEVGGILGASKVHRIGHTGLNVRVGMIDTGHFGARSSASRLPAGMPVLFGPYATDPADDWYGHGTGESANIYATAPARGCGRSRVSGTRSATSTSPSVHASAQVLSNSWGLLGRLPGL